MCWHIDPKVCDKYRMGNKKIHPVTDCIQKHIWR